MRYLIFSIPLFFWSCNEQKPAHPAADFTTRIVDFAVKFGDDKTIALPDLYTSRATGIPALTDDSAVLTDRLRDTGFRETGRERKDFGLSGKTLHVFTMTDGTCNCTVEKEYAATGFVSRFDRTERIRCVYADGKTRIL
jgi:hypothetical protein